MRATNFLLISAVLVIAGCGHEQNIAQIVDPNGTAYQVDCANGLVTSISSTNGTRANAPEIGSACPCPAGLNACYRAP